MHSHRTCTVVQKSVWSRARAICSITCMQAPAYGLCCNIIPYYLLPHLIPAAQLWSMMWDMDLYPETNMLTVSMCTYHLPSTYPEFRWAGNQVIWFPIWPALPGYAGVVLLSTCLQSLEQCSGPQAGLWSMSQWLPLCRVTGCAAWAVLSHLHACQWTDRAVLSVWQRGTGAAGQGGSLRRGYLTLSPWAHASTHHWLPIRK